MQKVTKVLNGIVNLIFYPIVAVVLAVGIMFALGIKPYITMSGSMEPAIQTGSVCFVNTKAEYQDMQEGDVIAYKLSTGGLVTHRVISVTGEGLETKGDNNDFSDGVSTTSANFHGQTLFSVPYVGYILKTLQEPTYFIMILVVVGGILLFNFVDSYYAKKEEEAAQEEPEQMHSEIAKPEKPRGRKRGKYEAVR